MTTAPWWATGLFTIAGAVIAFFATATTNRRRNRFEDSRRWHEDRKNLYLDVTTQVWAVQDAIYDHYELDRDLPNDFGELHAKVEKIKRTVELIGSEEVNSQCRQLFVEAHGGITCVESNDAGAALDKCDNMRHRLYYVTDLMRSELNADRRAVNRWHANRPASRREHDRLMRWIERQAIGKETWERGPDGELIQTSATGVVGERKPSNSEVHPKSS